MSVVAGPTAFERKLPTEDADIAEIVRNILKAQASFAAKQHRPLGRGTHTKGVGVRATFEVFAVPPRLARGPFARPGVYPATVRFANAASTINRDRKRDVRACSFSVDLSGARHDFSLNNATTFPINDPHEFAVLVRLLNAGGLWPALRVIAGLSFRELRGLLLTTLRGARQERRAAAYQRQRYWSNVPFLHGADEAVKYSLIPGPDNAAKPLGRGPNALQAELARHLQDDSSPAYFDFGIQFLDTAVMTHRRDRHDATFWVENASVEWPEAQAPFHVAGRLRLLPGPLLPPETTEAMSIDVTTYSTPETRPIGGINRARWPVETASRNARLDAATSFSKVLQAENRVRRPLRFRSTALLWTAAAVFALVFAGVVYLDRGAGPLPVERVDDVVYGAQGWGDGLLAAPRQTYYYTAQGASLRGLRYSWFVHLETPLGTDRLADPAFMRRFGFLVDPATPSNPDQLPVGFTSHFDRQVNEQMLDLTCAACHTGQLNVTRNGRTTALRIDGGSALHAFTNSSPGHFIPVLTASMLSTAWNPLKFNRFAERVLGDDASVGRKWALHGELRDVIGNFIALGYHEKRYGLAPTEEGYGRTDALARIANTVFGDNLDAINYKAGDAPVSFPPVWNIWKFDWVQYNASVSQPMARNIGEAMGTGATYSLIDETGSPLPASERFRSSALVANLHTIETTLHRLRPPSWNEAVLGTVDRQLADRGKGLFNTHCVGCHGPNIAPPAVKARNAPLKTAADPEWLVETVCLDHVGTDPRTAMNFYNATVDITRTGMTADDLRRVASEGIEAWKQRQAVALPLEIARLRALTSPSAEDRAQLAEYEEELRTLDRYGASELSQLDPRRLPVGSALSYLGTMIRGKAYADARYTVEEQKVLNGFDALDRPQIVAAYKPRPLAGAWATPPFLHNGSVPTIYHLLSPVSQRPVTFTVGSREYDPTRLGLADPTAMGLGPASEYFTFDTRLPGNNHVGHEFDDGPERSGKIGPRLSEEEKLAIIEHLKIRDDDVDGPQGVALPWPSVCKPVSIGNPEPGTRN